LVVTYLAAWRVAAAVSPVPVQWRAHELAYVLGLTGARAFIVARTFKDFDHLEMARKLQAAHASLEHVVPFDTFHDEMAGHALREDLDEATARLDANDIAVIQWTSGTEAEPKACPMSHNNWGFARFIYCPEFKGGVLEDGSILMNPAPLVNMTCIGVGLVPWILISGTFVLHHPFEPLLFMRQLIEEGVNFTLAVPAMAVGILKHPAVDAFDLGKLKYLAQGSAPPAPWTFVEIQRRWGTESINIWGQNEGTGLFSLPEVIPDMEKRASGFPRGWRGVEWDIPVMQAIEVKIVDEAGKELTEPDEVGELCYKAPLTMAGYFNQPELSERSFDEEGFFRTGDLFRIIDERVIAFFDRKKDMIIRGGFNISAAEVENILKGHPDIADAAVIGMPDEVLGERTCAFIVTGEGATLTLDDVKAFMESEGVANYKWPERIEIVEEIPRNPVGKVIKTELRRTLGGPEKEGP
jgi:acyl-CoA synthetase (AMP-forming)/AMP-acid ligase II